MHPGLRTGSPGVPKTMSLTPNPWLAGHPASISRIEKGPMQDPGLNHRLQQRSRRSGFMIGLTMALTLAVCVGSFTFIYAQLEPMVSDFVSNGETAVPTSPAEIAAAAPTQQPAAQTAADDDDEQLEPTEEPADDPEPTEEPEPTPDSDEFDPDYQIDSPSPVNLRAGPSVNNSGEPIIAVPIDAPLMFLGETAPTEDPEGDGLGDGQVWMLFQTENGQEGWIREIDVTEYTP